LRPRRGIGQRDRKPGGRGGNRGPGARDPLKDDIVQLAEHDAELARQALRVIVAGARGELTPTPLRSFAKTGDLSDCSKIHFGLADEQEALGPFEALHRPGVLGDLLAVGVSAGDVVSPGGALFTVVNPASMRLEASVPASQLTSIRVGLPVEFSVTGYPNRLFGGRITRVSPTADPTTRQVRIVATIPNAGNTLVGGLFAEGRGGGGAPRPPRPPGGGGRRRRRASRRPA
jgi:multidrug efflux pump subunit AcrA (membrane-fusion protein)